MRPLDLEPSVVQPAGVADERDDEQDTAGPLIPPSVEGKNGGTLHPWQPGQSGNPAGRPSRRTLLAREVARQAGLEELLALASKVRARRGEVAEGLLELAAAGSNPVTRVAAQKLLWELLGVARREGEAARLDLTVEVRRKSRPAEADRDDEPLEVEHRVLDAKPSSNGNGSSNGHA